MTVEQEMRDYHAYGVEGAPDYCQACGGDSRIVGDCSCDLQAECVRRTLSQLELSGLRAALARRDRTRGWLA